MSFLILARCGDGSVLHCTNFAICYWAGVLLAYSTMALSPDNVCFSPDFRCESGGWTVAVVLRLEWF